LNIHEKIGHGVLTVVLVPILTTAIFFISLPIGLLHAWVIGKLWGWFITPQFGLAAPKLWMLYGLVLTFRMFESSTRPDDDKPKDKLVQKFLISAIFPLLFLSTGWFAHWMAR